MGASRQVVRWIGTIAWPVAAVVSVALLVANRRASDRASAYFEQQRDSLERLLRVNAASAYQTLGIGDSLPDVELVDASGHRLRARDLARRGARYWYLYRDECPACQILRPSWTVESEVVSGVLVRVAFHPSRDLAADSGAGSYGWRHDSVTRVQRIVEYVPALLDVNRFGIITAAAYGLPRVSKMGGYLGLLNRQRVDSAVSALQTSEPRLP